MPAAPESTEQSISQTESIPLSPSKKMVKFDSDESHVEGDIKPSSTMLFDPDTQSSSVMPTTTESETPDKSRSVEYRSGGKRGPGSPNVKIKAPLPQYVTE